MKNNPSFYMRNFKRFIGFIFFSSIYMLVGLAISIFFIINKSQQELLDFSLADSYILIGESYISGFLIAFPFLVALCFLLFQNFKPYYVLNVKRRQIFWYQQSMMIFIFSFFWTVLTGLFVFLLSFRFISKPINWEDQTSFFFFKTEQLIDVSFFHILLLTLLTIWLVLAIIGELFLLVYWYTDTFIICFFCCLLILGVMQLKPVLNYYSVIHELEFIYKKLSYFILWLFLIFGLPKFKVITGKDFYE